MEMSTIIKRKLVEISKFSKCPEMSTVYSDTIVLGLSYVAVVTSQLYMSLYICTGTLKG